MAAPRRDLTGVDRYAVMGDPIAHSKSPEIHARFAEQTGESLAYDRLRVTPAGFAEAVAAFESAGGRGLNFTVPLKEAAWRLARHRSDRAERAGAVNTLVLGDGDRYGDNTDGVGLIRDLRDNHGVTLEGRRILLLGAGGAARGVLPSVLAERPNEVIVANRSPARAEDLASRMTSLGRLRASTFEALAAKRFDLVINATSAGLDGAMPALPDNLLAKDAVCYDLVYGDGARAFVRWSRAQGAAQALDGLGMLVEQAAESFVLWRGVRPQTASVIRALRSGFAVSEP